MSVEFQLENPQHRNIYHTNMFFRLKMIDLEFVRRFSNIEYKRDEQLIQKHLFGDEDNIIPELEEVSSLASCKHVLNDKNISTR